MKKSISISVSVMIWANIRKIQNIGHISDEKLAYILEVSTRTLYNYDKEPERLTLKKIEGFMKYTGVQFQYLIQ